MTKQKRLEIFNKYDGHCAYCGCQLKDGWHIDHINPQSKVIFVKDKEVNNSIDNLMPSCPSCNINKRERDIEQFRQFIYDMRQSLKIRNVNYQVCLKYGIIEETDKEIKFYFEQKKENSNGKEVIIAEKQKPCPNCKDKRDYIKLFQKNRISVINKIGEF